MADYENNYGMRSIRNRIIFFALLLTLAPSLTMGWLLNSMLQAALAEKTEQKLIDTSLIIEKEISFWFKERYYDLYEFSSSPVLTEHLLTLNAESEGYSNNSSPLKAVTTYLDSLQKEFSHYRRLFLLRANGSVIATASENSNDEGIKLPEDLGSQVASASFFQGAVYINETNTPLMLIGIPLFHGQSHDQYAGFLAVEVNLNQLFSLIKERLGGDASSATIQYSLTDVRTGVHLFSTNLSDTDLTAARISFGAIRGFGDSAHLKDFFDERGIRVIGVIRMLNRARWELIIAEDYAVIFERSIQARKRNILITFCLTFVIGLSGYLFARQIVIPLQALRDGAKKVAAGDLDVALPVTYKDELGFTISVFNEMVSKLRISQHELKQLATIDSLTQLKNRKRIMELLKNHFDYFKRYKTPFCVLMIDVDHFKQVNDTFSHLAGDEVLRQLAHVFGSLLRNLDSAGRYGGEEFLIILAKTDGKKGVQVAERIRKTIEQLPIAYKNARLSVTVSIGVAEISPDDENEEKLVARADEALYRAKNSGRNLVVVLEE